MSWAAAIIAFFIGVIVGFLLCGFFAVIAEDREHEVKRDEQRGVRRQ